MWIQRIQKSFKKLFTVPSQPLTGFLGNRSGVVATGTTGFVYVTLLSSGQTVVARNTVVPMIPGLPVNVIRDPSNTYRVESVIDLHENLPYPEQSQPDTTPMTWPGASTVWIRDAQILDGLPIPIPNTLSVQVYGRWYFLENLFHVIDHTIVDLTSELPASGAEWVNVEIDSAGVVSFLHGTNVDTWEILTPEDVPISDSTKYFLFSVRMYVGQTQIRKVDGPDCDLFDPRFTRIGSGGGGTPVGGDTEIQFNDAGIFGSDTEFIFDKTTKTVRVGPYDRGIRLFGGAGDISQYAPDGENPVLDQHAWDGIPGIIPQVSEGTLASQAAISLGKVLWHVAVKAFNGTDFKDAGRIRAVATENHDGTSSGVKWEVYCVENTTNTEVLVATFDQDGNVNIASGKQYQVNGAQHTHPELDLATVIHAATEETSLHVDDEVGIWEHVSGLLRRVKFSTWISGLGAYFVPHSSATASNDFLVGVGTGAWIKKTLAETATILRTVFDSVYAAVGATYIYSAISPTTANVSAVEGTFYNADVSGLTADRDFNLPTPSAAGKTIGIRISAGDDTYELLLKINGTEWSRLFITGEVVEFLSTGTGAGDWIVKQDGRIPCEGMMGRITSSQTTNTAATQTTADWNSADTNIGNICDLTNNRFNIRRAGKYEYSAAYMPAAAISDGQYARLYILLDSTNIAHNGNRAAAATSLVGVGIPTKSVAVTVGQTLTYQFSTQAADMGLIYSAAAFEGSNYFRVKEVLP